MKKRRYFIWISIITFILANLFYNIYSIYSSRDFLTLHEFDVFSLRPECNKGFANKQLDTLYSCKKGDTLHVSLYLNLKINNDGIKVFAKESSYEIGKNRVYQQGGFGNYIDYVNCRANDIEISELYLGLDKLNRFDAINNIAFFEGELISLSDDDSKLIFQVILPYACSGELDVVESDRTGVRIKAKMVRSVNPSSTGPNRRSGERGL